MKRKSAFLEFFPDIPLVKVMDFFLNYKIYDYTKSQVANEVGISRITMDKVLEKLLKSKFIIKTREIGNGIYYKINIDNPKVRIMAKLDMELAFSGTEKEKPVRAMAQLS